MKRAVLIFLLAAVAASSFNCRKKMEADSWLVGHWIGYGNSYDYQVIDIKSDGTGCNKDDDYKKVRVNSKSIKIGSKEFDIVDQPSPVDSAEFRNSALYNYYPPSHARPTLRMNLHLPLFSGHYDIVFYKCEQ